MRSLTNIIAAVSFCVLTITASAQYTKYVNPFIGTSATGHTFPGATVPFGLVQLSPETGNFGWHYSSGYRYEDTTITGFAHTHLSGTGGVDLGDVLFFPFQGNAPKVFKTGFDKKSEKASPGYYAITLKGGIKAELTASAHTGLHRYTFYKPGEKHLLIDLQSGLVDAPEELETHVSEGSIKVVDSHTIEGYAFSSLWVDKQVYFVAKFEQAITGHRFIDTNNRRLVLDFGKPNAIVEAKVAISAVSIAGARKNLAETLNKPFDAARAEADKTWNAYLNKANVSGSPAQLTTFYTALYHTLIQPNNIADVDGYYRGPDNKIHQSVNGVYYSTLSLWDTYRAAHPLYTILYPNKAGGMVETMLQHFKIAKLLPVWTLWGKESYAMIGNHAIPVIVDASLKGIKGFNRQEAFDAIKYTLKHNKNPKYNWDIYMWYGYLPSDSVTHEAVSRTLEANYDDWCAAQLAKALTKPNDAEYFTKRSEYYQNLFDPSTNLMRGKLANGKWVQPFAHLDSGQLATGGDYTEGNAWQYVWQVQHNIPSLIKLMGGQKPFISKLDSLFTMEPKVFGKGSTLDVTGLIGQYAHGNEPVHHVAYLYTMGGRPAKTQQMVRRIAEEFYRNTPEGLAGNDDCGQMSAWYVFTAMGFYPVNPANGEYVFGAPQLSRVTIGVPGNKKFTIIANGLSRSNKYIKSIKLNGRLYLKDYITHQDIMKGGTLVFEMTDKPQ